MSVPDWMIDTPSASVDDMAALIRRLVRDLRKAAPDNDLSEKALDYFRRHGLTGEILRATPPAAPAATEAPSDRRAVFEAVYAALPGGGGLKEFCWRLWQVQDATPAPAVGASLSDERYRKLREWYLRGGTLAEIHPFGHIEVTTPEIFDAGVDALVAVGASVQPVLASLSDEQIDAVITAAVGSVGTWEEVRQSVREALASSTPTKGGEAP